MTGRRLASVSLWEWLAAAGLLAIPWLVVLVCFWPGHMNGDTLYQLQQVRTGDITDKHSPVLQWLWHLVWPLGVGTGWALAATTAAFLAGAYLLLRASLRPVAAAGGAALVALSPQVVGYLGGVIRDTWFAALVVLTFGLLAAAAGRQGRARLALLAAAVVAAWLALATRQNAGSAVFVALALVPVLGLGWLGALARRWPGWSPRRRVLVAGGIGLGACVLLIASQLALSAVIGVRSDRPEEFLYSQDISRITESTGDRSEPAKGSDADETRDNWLRTVSAHPFAYARVRAEMLLDNLAVTRRPVVVYHPGIDPNEQGFVIANPGENEAMLDYLEAFSDPALGGTPVHWVWIYLLLCIVAAALFMRGPVGPLFVAGSMGLAMVTFQLGILAFAITPGYRFEYVTVVCGALLGLLLAARLAFRRWPAVRSALGCPASGAEGAPGG